MEEKNKDNKKKGNGFSVRKLIFNDKYLIIISVLLAVVVWCATSMNLSPETTKTVTVPVTVDFSDSAASQLGIKCFGEETIDVDVTVSCKKYLAKDITADDLNVYLQTNTVTTNGNMEVPIRVDSGDNKDFSVISYYPTVYKAYFDVEDEKVMDISIQYENDDFIRDGYVMGQELLSESSVTVKGPKTYVSQVKSVVTSVNFTESINTTQTLDATITPVDSYGNKVDYISFETKNEKITLTIPVLKKTVLSVTSSFTGKPANLNINDFDVSYSVNKVNAGVLEEAKLDKANIGNIDFSQLTVGENKIDIDVNNLESFAILDDISHITVTVKVPDTYSTKSIPIGFSNVEITNIPKGYKAEIVSLSASRVTAVGPENDLGTLSRSNVKLTVDLSSLGDKPAEGNTSCNVTTSLEGSNTCWIYGSYKATVKLYK